MMFIGITGHRGLSPHSARLIDTALHEALAEYSDRVTGVTALADGAVPISSSPVRFSTWEVR